MMDTQKLKNHSSKPNLLIADDHTALRNTLALWIENLYPEIQILEAENGLEAIQICQHSCIDLILLDLKMPDIDGFKVTRRVKEICPKTQVYLMSIYDGDAYRREALLSGASGFFSKTTMDKDLPLALARFMESKEI